MFIELAVRGIREVHHHYLIWSIGQEWKKELDFHLLNDGPGVAYADETTVCAAISQEFLYSRFPSGTWVDTSCAGAVLEGPRHYELCREYNYPDNANERADLYTARVDPNSGNIIGRPTLIEAKRAFRWPTKLDGVDQSPTKTLTKIKEDIDALRRAEKHSQNFRGYILVWNVADTQKATDVSADDYIAQLNDPAITIWQQRYLPLTCADAIQCLNSPVTVSRWLWVALAEVTSP